MKKKILLALFIASIFYSCINSSIYKANIEVNQNGWNYHDHLKYEFNIEDIQNNYNLLINLNFLKTYKYNNLFFFVDVKDPENKTYRDTIECILAIPNGKWIGNISGDLVSQQLTYRYNVNFPIKGQYKIEIQHAMRDSLLRNVTSVGLELNYFEEQ